MRILVAVICLIGSHLGVWAQRTVSGTVSDENGQPLTSITIRIIGSSQGAMTDVDGKFRIAVPDDYAILVFTGSGFIKQETTVGTRDVIDIVLIASAVDRGETIATGYGSQSKKQITGNVSQVSGESIRDNPVSNLESSMQGRTAGVIVKATGVQVRGSASLTASNQPLYVVDGVPLASGSQSSINPTNIKSMEILKDASAAAIYGSRAANGVIVITTHSGRQGKMQIEADYQLGVSTTPKYLDMYSRDDYNQQVIEFRVRQFGLGEFVTADNLRIWQQTQESGSSLIIGNVSFNTLGQFLNELVYDTDWQKRVFQTGLSHRATVSAQGGGEKIGYYVSTVFNTKEGILIGQQSNNFNGLLSMDAKVTSKLTANLSVNFLHGKENRLREDQDLGSPLQAIALPPSDQPDPTNYGYLRVTQLLYNPETEIHNSDNIGLSNAWIGSLGLNYVISDQLTFDMTAGIDFSDLRDELRLGPQTRDGGGTYIGLGSGRSQLGTSQLRNYLLNGWATYTPAIGENSDLSIVVGSSYEKADGEFSLRTANINSISELENMAIGNSLLTLTNIPGSASAFVSNFSRINYSYKDRYLLQISGRRDGSSKFPENNRYGIFTAVSGGWIVSDEPFFAKDGFIRFLKLKGSYGQIGNMPIGDFDYQKNYAIVQYGATSGYDLLNPSNENLKWETTSQVNVGLEYSLGNRVSGSVDYYVKDTKDLLFPVPVSLTSGFSSMTLNGGSMTNSGVELALNTNNIDLPDWKWTSSFNISFTKNSVSDLPGEKLVLGTNAFIEGQPASVFYMRRYVGVDRNTGDALYDNGSGGTTNNWESADRMVVGNPNPGYFGGITNSITYKNFDLSFMVQFVGDVDVYYATGEFLSNSGILGLTQLASQRDRWMEPGDNAKYPGVDPFNTDTHTSTRWLEDGSYARLTNLILTFKLPATKVQQWGLSYAEVYIGGQNLLTISNYTGYDPDVVYVDPTTGTLGQNINKGVDNFTAPQPRIFTTGIKIGL